MKSDANYRSSFGFTIVELLVVIVVIGILAAITIVSYTGITNRAVIASIQSDLNNASTQLKLDQVTNGIYPATLALANGGMGVRSSPGTTYQYGTTGGGQQTFCTTATNGGQSYNINQDGIITLGGKNLFQKSATFSLYNTGTDNANPAATYITDAVSGDYQTFVNTNGGNRYWYPWMSESRVQGQTYTISLEINTTNASWQGYWYPSENYINLVFPNTGGLWQRWSWTYIQTGATSTGNKLFGFHNTTAGSSISFRKLKLEVGNTATCWVSEP